MKRNIFIFSIMSLLFVGLLVSVYAAFTSNSTIKNNDIVVGKVDINATINGETDGKVEIDNLKPGTSQTFTISIENNSDYDIQYRTLIISENFATDDDHKLLDILTFEISEVDVNFKAGYGVTDWYKHEYSETDNNFTYDLTISMNKSVSNEYQELSFDFMIQIEAREGDDLSITTESELDDFVSGEYVKLGAGFTSLTINKDLYLNLDGKYIEELTIEGFNINKVEIVNGSIGKLNINASKAEVFVYAPTGTVSAEFVGLLCYFADTTQSVKTTNYKTLTIDSGLLIVDTNDIVDITLDGGSSLNVANGTTVNEITVVDSTEQVSIVNNGVISNIVKNGLESNLTIEGNGVSQMATDNTTAYVSLTDEEYYFTENEEFKKATRVSDLTEALTDYSTVYINQGSYTTTVTYLHDVKVIGINDVTIEASNITINDVVEISSVIFNVTGDILFKVEGTLVLNDVYIKSNYSNVISSLGDLTLKNCYFETTTETTVIYTSGTLEIDNVTFSNFYIAILEDLTSSITTKITNPIFSGNYSYKYGFISDEKAVVSNDESFLEQEVNEDVYFYKTTYTSLDKAIAENKEVYILDGSYKIKESHTITDELTLYGGNSTTIINKVTEEVVFNVETSELNISNITFTNSGDSKILFKTTDEITLTNVAMSGFDINIATISLDKMILSDNTDYIEFDGISSTAIIYPCTFSELSQIEDYTDVVIYVLDGTYTFDSSLANIRFVALEEVEFNFTNTIDSFSSLIFEGISFTSEGILFSNDNQSSTLTFIDCEFSCKTIFTGEIKNILISNSEVITEYAFILKGETNLISFKNSYECITAFEMYEESIVESIDDTFTCEVCFVLDITNEQSCSYLLTGDYNINYSTEAHYYSDAKIFISSLEQYLTDFGNNVHYFYERVGESLESYYETNKVDVIYLSGEHTLNSKLIINNNLNLIGENNASIKGNNIEINAEVFIKDVTITNNSVDSLIESNGSLKLDSCKLYNSLGTAILIEGGLYLIENCMIDSVTSIEINGGIGEIKSNTLKSHIVINKVIYVNEEKYLPEIKDNFITYTTIHIEILNLSINSSILFNFDNYKEVYSNDEIKMACNDNIVVDQEGKTVSHDDIHSATYIVHTETGYKSFYIKFLGFITK